MNKACVACAPSQNAAGTGVNGACPTATPVCGSGNTCLPCLTGNNNGTTGANGACPAATPVCDANNSGCVGCNGPGQCPPGALCDVGAGSDNSKTCLVPALTGFTATATVSGNSFATLTLTLDRAAAAGGLTVHVSIDTGDAGHLDAGRTGKTANIAFAEGETTKPVVYYADANEGTAHLTATLGTVTLHSVITISNSITAEIASVTVKDGSAASVQAGATLPLRANLNISASAAGLRLDFTSGNGGTVSPASATLTQGDTGADLGFIAGHAPTAGTPVTISATNHDTAAHAAIDVTITPFFVQTLAALPASVGMGGTSTLTITLNANAASDTTVALSLPNATLGTLSTGGAGAASVDVVISQGTKTATATFTAACPLAADATAIVTAHLNQASDDATANIAVIAPRVQAVLPPYQQIAPGSVVPMTIALDSIVGCDVTVPLDTSSHPAGTVPASVTVKAQTARAQFSYTAGAGTTPIDNTVTATLNGPTTARVQIPPTVKDVLASKLTVSAGSETSTITVELDSAPPSGSSTEVYLSAGKTPQAFKYTGYVPQKIVIAAPATSGTAVFNPGYFHGTTGTDSAVVSAQVAPKTVAANSSYWAKSPTITVGPSPAGPTVNFLTPLQPFLAEHPYTTNLAGGPLPLVITATVSMAATGTPGTVAATFKSDSTDCGTLSPTSIPVSGTSTTLRVQFNFTPKTGLSAALPKTCNIQVDLGVAAGAPVGVVQATAAVTLVAAPKALPADHLVINKVETDNVGSAEDKEYVELYNPTENPIVLDGTWALVFFSSANDDGSIKTVLTSTALVTTPLTSVTIPRHGRMVVGDTAFNTTLTASADLILVTLKTGAVLVKQINDNPGGVALMSGPTVVDSMTYGGTAFGVTGAPLPAAQTFTFPLFGRPLDPWIFDSNFIAGQLVRLKDGLETGNPALDWRWSTASPTATVGGVLVMAPNDVTGP